MPIAWGCVGAHLAPIAAPIGFLITALCLERRPGPRLAIQALIFALWSVWLALDAGPAPDLSPPSRMPAGTFAPGSAAAPHPGNPRWAGLPRQSLTGTVRSFPIGSGGNTFLFETDPGDAEARTLRITLEGADALPQGGRLIPGQRLALRGRAREAEGPTNPGQFNQLAFLRANGIAGLFRADSLRFLEEAGLFHRGVAAVRAGLQGALAATVPAERLPLFEAALLGDAANLDPSVMEDFRASGMLHILAISGQHVGIIALILLQAFSLLRLPRKAAFLATGAVLAFYVPVCGGSISVIRSALMFWATLPGILWERPSQGVNNLALAGCVCLVWMPWQILNLGCQLSFGATFLLLHYSRPISRSLARLRRSLPGPLQAAVGYAWPNAALSAAIFLGLFPLLAATVHTVSPASIAGNLATVGLSSAMLVAGCLALLASPLPLLGACFGESAGMLAGWLALIIKGLARLPGSCLSAEALPGAWSALLLLLILALPFALRRGRGRLLALLGLAAFSGRWAAHSAGDLWRRPVTVAFLDVGQGDATVLRLPGADLLIDAGPADAGREAILPWLRQAGIGGLDRVVITHPDLDHYGGLAWLAERFPVESLIHSGDRADTKAWLALEAAASARGIPWAEARAGQLLYRYGDITLEVLSPPGPGRFRERNDNSVVCLLRTGRSRMLLTGDMERESQAWLLRHGPRDLRGAILKVPHHGSDRTTDTSFLAALAPEAAVISAGRRNRFGHPGPANLAALGRSGSRLFLTPTQGAIVFREDRRGAAWEAFLPGPPGRNF